MRRNPHNSGFTLIELLVVILVIALLIGLLLAGVLAVQRSTQGVADLQSARAMATAVQQFENDNGFPVPLVFDGDPIMLGDPPTLPALIDDAAADGVLQGFDADWANLPVLETTSGSMVTSMAVYSEQRDLDFLRGGRDANGDDVVTFTLTPEDSRTSDLRYSKFALPIYLTGVLDRRFDGVDGPGLTKPYRDGTFAGVTGQGARTPKDAYMEPRQNAVEIAQAYADALEYAEHHGDGGSGPLAGRQFARPFVDRYGRAFRYYRWEAGRSTRVADDLGGDVGSTTDPIDLNIPFVVSDMLAYAQQADPGNPDRARVDVTGGSAELRAARWAIVGAGPDGYFGTEPMSVLDTSGSAQSEEDVILIRQRAQRDNVVILGR